MNGEMYPRSKREPTIDKDEVSGAKKADDRCRGFFRHCRVLFAALCLSVTPWSSPRSESCRNGLQRNRGNTSLCKVAGRWWDSPIRRCCPIWRRRIVLPSCSAPTVVSGMNNYRLHEWNFRPCERTGWISRMYARCIIMRGGDFT